MSQYGFSKDWRTDRQYRRYFEVGRRNQLYAVRQLGIDLQLKRPEWEGLVDFEEIPDKAFQDEGGSWQYRPDFIFRWPDGTLHLEVKCSQNPAGDTIDIKKSQVDQLALFKNGTVLYSAGARYALLSVATIRRLGVVCGSERFGGKEVYQLTTAELKWRWWLHLPEFEKYYSIKA